MAGIQIRDLVDVSDLLGDEVFPVDSSTGKTGKAPISKVANYTISRHKGEPNPHPELQAYFDAKQASANAAIASLASTVAELGALATKSTITDAEIAEAAAIAQSKISGLVASLQSKQDLLAPGSLPWATLTNIPTTVAGYGIVDSATLVNGKVPTSQLSNDYLVNTTTVSSQAQMLALDFQQGDFCYRSDVSAYFDLNGSDPKVLRNWKKRQSSSLRSINQQTGPDVVLGAVDVGADPAGTAEQVRDTLTTDLTALQTTLTTQINGKQPTGDYALATAFTALQASLGSAAFRDASTLGSAKVRASSRVVTANLEPGQTGFYLAPLAKTFKLLRIEVSSQCRTRIYSSPAARASDVSRPPLTDQDPFPAGIGLIAEVNLVGLLSIDLDNLTGSSMEAQPSESFAIAVTNNSSTQTAITLTLHYLKLED